MRLLRCNQQLQKLPLYSCVCGILTESPQQTHRAHMYRAEIVMRCQCQSGVQLLSMWESNVGMKCRNHSPQTHFTNHTPSEATNCGAAETSNCGGAEASAVVGRKYRTVVGRKHRAVVERKHQLWWTESIEPWWGGSNICGGAESSNCGGAEASNCM